MIGLDEARDNLILSNLGDYLFKLQAMIARKCEFIRRDSQKLAPPDIVGLLRVDVCLGSRDVLLGDSLLLCQNKEPLNRCRRLYPSISIISWGRDAALFCCFYFILEIRRVLY